MQKKTLRTFFLLLFLTAVLVVIDLPENYRLRFAVGPLKIDQVINPPHIRFSALGLTVDKKIQTHLGLDLSGGSEITLEADMKNIAPADRMTALESARAVIERRINFFGVSEPIVQSAVGQNSYRIIVELPGVGDVTQAMRLIGQTAQLEFRELTVVPEASAGALFFPDLTNTKSVGITGKDLTRALSEFSSQTGEPEVALEFNSEGSRKFAEVTRRLVGKPLAIFLDGVLLMSPNVNTEITNGKAVITGTFTQEETKNLALQLNAGALPVPVKVVEKRIVGATLGAESVAKSIRAGAVGLAVVAVFMIAKYGWLGVLADLALILYGLLTLALFRLIPITLTLPGIAGFILSMGMAVDSNILIFERYNEERRAGRPWKMAMEYGFGKAWDSIRDANITTVITCIILFNPGNWQFLPSSGMVRGFAVTLFLGVVVGLFTGIVATRTFIRVLYKEKP